MIGSIVHQLTDNISEEEIQKSGLGPYYVDHGVGVYPANAGGIPFSADSIQSTGNPVTDLYEDLAAEQKAKATYQYILNLTDDPDVITPIKFLREREVIHFQRFGEALRIVEDYLDSKRQFIIEKPDFMKNKCGCKDNLRPEPRR